MSVRLLAVQRASEGDCIVPNGCTLSESNNDFEKKEKKKLIHKEGQIRGVRGYRAGRLVG